ncbi:MAG TPA: alpha/beta hydrolase [Streptosporangiaceae bacterium]|nr:alpha/beta hydrolase [Streptosporangiaceae bacterium]
MTQDVRLADGHSVTVESWGAPDGMPIFLLHGTPGCRSGPRPRTSVLYRLGVQLISYDRPGYGGSSRRPGRIVADAASDVSAIADALGLDGFGIVGRSGGGPHALACAALLGDRVQSAAVLVGLAPSDAEGLDWYEGMAGSNVDEYSKADTGLAAIERKLVEFADRIRDDPESLLEFLLPELTPPDRRVVDDVAIRRLLTDTYAEALRDSADGWIDDVLAIRRPWGFDLSMIQLPVLLWHGAEDAFSPVGHTYWLAKQVPTSIVAVQSGAAHFGSVEILPSVLAWIKRARGSEGLWFQGMHQPAFST